MMMMVVVVAALMMMAMMMMMKHRSFCNWFAPTLGRSGAANNNNNYYYNYHYYYSYSYSSFHFYFYFYNHHCNKPADNQRAFFLISQRAGMTIIESFACSLFLAPCFKQQVTWKRVLAIHDLRLGERRRTREFFPIAAAAAITTTTPTAPPPTGKECTMEHGWQWNTWQAFFRLHSKANALLRNSVSLTSIRSDRERSAC